MTCPHIDVYTKQLGEYAPISCPYCAADADRWQRNADRFRLLPIVIDACWFCENPWGGCTCSFSDGAEGRGFSTIDMWITSPNVSECARFYVNPIRAYGAPFIKWVKEQPDILGRLSNDKRALIDRVEQLLEKGFL
jgi:hypothetical protein